MYDTILLPVDGSTDSTRAEQTALSLAEEFDADLHVVHVLDRREYPEPALSTLELVTIEAEDRARAYVEEIATEAQSRGIAVETDCSRGEPSRKIERYAAESDADLLVVGGRDHEETVRRVTGEADDETTPRILTV